MGGPSFLHQYTILGSFVLYNNDIFQHIYDETREEETVDTHALSFGLGLFGPLGLFILLIMAGAVAHQYRDSSLGSFRWNMRTIRLKQVSALSCLFCMAMAASYGVLQEAWAFLYLIAAFKIGTWWFRLEITQRL
jgi:uncharacterized BrkB/YihY/UPF0761 family membrane protein